MGVFLPFAKFDANENEEKKCLKQKRLNPNPIKFNIIWWWRGFYAETQEMITKAITIGQTKSSSLIIMLWSSIWNATHIGIPANKFYTLRIEYVCVSNQIDGTKIKKIPKKKETIVNSEQKKNGSPPWKAFISSDKIMKWIQYVAIL